MMNEDGSPAAFRIWPFIFALVAIFLVLGSLIYSYKSSQQVAEFNDVYQTQLEKFQSIQRLLTQCTEQISKLDQETQLNKKAINRVRLFSSQQEKAMQQLVVGIESNRNEMIQFIEQLNNGAVAKEVSESSLEPSAANSEAKPRVHRIEAGDNFARIAKVYNVGLKLCSISIQV